MNKFLFGAALVLAIGGLAFAGTSTPELQLTSGLTNSGVISMPGTGSVTYNNANFAGWDISFVTGVSNSPGITPFLLDISSLSAACVTATCATLTVDLSDIGYATTTPQLVNTYSSTDTGAAASTSQTVWWDTTYFTKTHLVGAVGPLLGAGGFGSVSGPGATSTPYSITLEDTFAGCSGSGCVSYSSDGNVTGVPEPGSIALLGAALLFCCSRLRRRTA